MRPDITKKIERIRYYLTLLQTYKKECEERFEKDPMFEGAVLHYLYLVADGCISLAEMTLKHKGLGPAQSYYEAIDMLGDYGILPRDFAYRFAKIASFRNFLAHDYEAIEAKLICEALMKRLEEVHTFLGFIEKA